MKGKALLILVGVALASGAMSAQAAKPPMTDAQKKAGADAVAANHKQSSFQQPRTMAEANGTIRQTATGGTAISVPEELWNTLGVRKTADGKVHMTESDGTTPTAAKSEGLPNE